MNSYSINILISLSSAVMVQLITELIKYITTQSKCNIRMELGKSDANIITNRNHTIIKSIDDDEE